MDDLPRISISLCLGAALLCSGCGDGDADGSSTGALTLTGSSLGDGDGDPGGEPDMGAPGCDGTSPYMGGWDIGCCQDEIVQNGWAPGGVNVGTIMPDWTLTDQFGEAVRLYDFCHDAVWFEYVALW
jgi:hypothetical protein